MELVLGITLNLKAWMGHKFLNPPWSKMKMALALIHNNLANSTQKKD